MFYVATLIARPDRPALSEALAGNAARRVRGGPVEWLAPGVAADIAFEVDDAAAGNLNAASARTHVQGVVQDLVQSLRDAIGGEAIDVVVQPREGRRKKLLLADMDSTMIGQECIDELADYAGLKSKVAAITDRAMRGEIAFEPALRERVALLKGVPARVIDEVIAERITLTAGGQTLVATMRAHGAYTCVVSGGFTAFTSRLAAKIGFDEQRANVLIADADGLLTGAVADPALGSDAKLKALGMLRERLGLGHLDTLAVGDGANDIPMIKAAGLGIAFHGKPALRECAAACVDHGDLTALLYAQGYRREEFVGYPEAGHRM